MTYLTRHYCTEGWALYDAWDALMNAHAEPHLTRVAWLAWLEHRAACERCQG